MEEFEKSRLWQRTLAAQDGADEWADARERLRTAFRCFRDNAALLASEIPQGVRALTVHDITHADALWELTDQIAGEDYQINPAEAFVLGGAFLLHDLGMALAAYPGGLEQLKATPQWKDAVVAGLRQELGRQPTSGEVANAAGEVTQHATEVTLRVRHALQAEALPATEWPCANGKLHLLADPQLRESLGPLLGRIAHSHWWDLARVQNEFAQPLGAPTFCPPTWRIDPLKLACILRVVDACHLDDRRAPLLLRALRRPTGEAAQHWGSQGKLTKPRVEDDRVFFTSATAFPPEESEDWWLGHQLLTFADSELRDVDALFADLKDEARPRLRARSVAYAHDPKRLASLLKTEGWTPIDTRIRVTDVPELVRRFGGEALYGDDPTVPLRELIQNAADAVRARRVWESRPHDWGAITVRVGEDGGQDWLEVQDTGIGMDEEVLSGHLLDFGMTYWGSELMARQFPGLLASGFHPTGEFGIGFFSLFMWGPRVTVTTRSALRGPEGTLVLEFEGGSDGHPLLREAMSGEVLHEPGTRVRAWLRAPMRSRDGLLSGTNGRPCELQRLCAWLAPSLDVDLWVSEVPGQHVPAVGANDWLTIDARELLFRIGNAGPPAAVAARLTSLRDASGDLAGRASVADPQDSRGVVTVGGLRAGQLQGIDGVLIGTGPSITRREAVPVVDAAELARWATDQARLVAQQEEDPWVQCGYAEILAACGADTGDLAIAWGPGGWVSARGVVAWQAMPDEVWLAALGSVRNLRREEHDLQPQVLVTSVGVPDVLRPRSGSPPGGGWPAPIPADPLLADGLNASLYSAAIRAVAQAWRVSLDTLRETSSADDAPNPRGWNIRTHKGVPVRAHVLVLRNPRVRPTA